MSDVNDYTEQDEGTDIPDEPAPPAEAAAPEPKSVRDIIHSLADVASEIHRKYRIPYPQAVELITFAVLNTTTVPNRTEE